MDTNHVLHLVCEVIQIIWIQDNVLFIVCMVAQKIWIQINALHTTYIVAQQYGYKPCFKYDFYCGTWNSDTNQLTHIIS